MKVIPENTFLFTPKAKRHPIEFELKTNANLTITIAIGPIPGQVFPRVSVVVFRV